MACPQAHCLLILGSHVGFKAELLLSTTEFWVCFSLMRRSHVTQAGLEITV